MEANSPLLSSSKNEMCLCSTYEFIQAQSSHGECKQSAKYSHMPKVPWHGGNLCISPHPQSGSCGFQLRVISLFKKKTRELGEVKDFVPCIILDGPFCLLNPERKTSVTGKNALPWIRTTKPLHSPLTGL